MRVVKRFMRCLAITHCCHRTIFLRIFWLPLYGIISIQNRMKESEIKHNITLCEINTTKTIKCHLTFHFFHSALGYDFGSDLIGHIRLYQILCWYLLSSIIRVDYRRVEKRYRVPGQQTNAIWHSSDRISKKWRKIIKIRLLQSIFSFTKYKHPKMSVVSMTGKIWSIYASMCTRKWIRPKLDKKITAYT